jgi:type IV fimbrial biogenesis protein FimT
MALRRAAGFTLIELMVTIGVAAVLLTLALPSFTAAIRSNRVATSTNQVLATLNLARAEGLRSKSSGRVCPNNNGVCGTDWAGGMLVWTDENSNDTFDKSEVKRVIEASSGVVLEMPAGLAEIGFDDRGRTLDHASHTITLKAAECLPPANNVRKISVSRIGRVSMVKEACK